MYWSFWLQLLVRSALILLAGEGLRRLNKRRKPAFRHGLLLAAFMCLAMLPVFSILLPEITFPTWPASNAHSTVTIERVSFAARQQAPVQSLNWPLLIWFVGAAIASIPILAGIFSAWQLARRATLLRDEGWQKLIRELCSYSRVSRKLEVLISRESLVPLTCGILRPRILLPPAALEWDTARRRAVLLHELAHVRRWDVAAQLSVHLVAALWWFQPLVWLLRRSVREESEFACDAAALAFGIRPSQYASELLAIAKTAGTELRLSSFGISMARRGDLESRLRSVLNPPSAPLSQARLWTTALFLAAVTFAASAVTAGPTNFSHEPGGSTMKRSVFTGLLASVGLSAASISGSISDPNGAAIPDAKVLLTNPDTGAKQEAVSGPDGKFTLEYAPAGDYIFAVEKPGYSSIFRVFDLKEESTIDRSFTLAAGETPRETNAIPTGADTGAMRVRIGGQVAQSNLIRKVQPLYPVPAKAAGVQGTVEIEADISKEGVPVELRVVSSPSDDLSQASLEAVRQWRYRPTLLNGNPVEIVTDVIVNFTLTK